MGWLGCRCRQPGPPGLAGAGAGPGSEPAAGASGLPAGVFAPHVSPDDAVLAPVAQRRAHHLAASQPAPAGRARLGPHRRAGTPHRRHPGLPADWHAGPGADWTIPAPNQPANRRACRQRPWPAGTPGRLDSPAPAGAGLLREPGVTWRGQCAVASLRPMPGPMPPPHRMAGAGCARPGAGPGPGGGDCRRRGQPHPAGRALAPAARARPGVLGPLCRAPAATRALPGQWAWQRGAVVWRGADRQPGGTGPPSAAGSWARPSSAM